MGGRGSSSGIAKKTRFPELKGSEKQIKWAESIRNDALGTIDANIKRAKEASQKQPDFRPIMQDRIKAYEEIRKQIVTALQTYEKASDLINRRDMFSGNRIIGLADKMEEDIRKKRLKKK